MARETTALLSDRAAASLGPPAPTPLPKAQVATLACIRMLDPLALFVVLPLAPRMVRDFRPDLGESEIGYVSGWIETRCASSGNLSASC